MIYKLQRSCSFIQHEIYTRSLDYSDINADNVVWS